MPVENHSPEAAYASKTNIVTPREYSAAYTADIETRGQNEIAQLYDVVGPTANLASLIAAAKVASDASDAAVQADGGAAGATKTASTASKAAVDAIASALDTLARANA